MNDPARVRVVECGSHIAHDHQHIGER